MSANVPEPFVVGVQVASVTHRDRSSVQGGGGAGFTYKGTGYSFPIEVHTVHEKMTEVWVALPDGTEARLDFNDVDAVVREGHKLALLLGGDGIWGIKNFTTGTTTRFITADHFVAPSKSYGLGWAFAIFGGLCVALALPLTLAETALGWKESTSRNIEIVLALIGTPFVLGALSGRTERSRQVETAIVDQALSKGFAMLESAELNFPKPKFDA